MYACMLIYVLYYIRWHNLLQVLSFPQTAVEVQFFLLSNTLQGKPTDTSETVAIKHITFVHAHTHVHMRAHTRTHTQGTHTHTLAYQTKYDSAENNWVGFCIDILKAFLFVVFNSLDNPPRALQRTIVKKWNYELVEAALLRLRPDSPKKIAFLLV
jgi:hypothetical protein